MKSRLSGYTHATREAIRKCGCPTMYTVYGEIDMTNREPYRTKYNKALAAWKAIKVNGTYHSNVKREYH